VVVMVKEAPNFRGNFPLDGAQIGPAWRAAWALLSDGQWHSKLEIEPVMCEAGPIVPITALNLLRLARKAGVLETRRTVRPDRGCGPSDYRIKPEGGS
jgi:hypothetical protein